MSVGREAPLVDVLRTALGEAAAELARDGASSLDAETVAQLLSAAVVLFAARTAAGESAVPFAPVAALPAPTATDVCIAAAAMLDAVAVEVFELALWKTWGGAGQPEPPAADGSD